jgi:uncharacterized protein (TIGR00725 family)
VAVIGDSGRLRVRRGHLRVAQAIGDPDRLIAKPSMGWGGLGGNSEFRIPNFQTGGFMGESLAMKHGFALPILAVFGPADATPDEEAVAARVGAAAAGSGWVVLTGGGSGVMEAACRGAVEAGGVTVGILPTARAENGYPNPWVKISVFTGAGSARNAFNVLSSTLCVAIGGGPGTLSEIALALKTGTPVWCLKSWALKPPPGKEKPLPRVFESAEDLLSALEDTLQDVKTLER